MFSECPTPSVGQTGLPLGNLTSQLLVNIYMNEFDQFMKHTLKAKYYVRYADDFVILSHTREELAKTLPYMEVFLRERLGLELHPNKVSISTFASGIDFLGCGYTFPIIASCGQRRNGECRGLFWETQKKRRKHLIEECLVMETPIGSQN